MRKAQFLLTGLFFLGLGLQAETPIAESANERSQFIELFSSEGCSSCPPADRWIAKFAADPGLWKKITPLAWHVTYWNRLGWTDPLSKEEMTERQVAISKLWDKGSIYTPGVVLNGQEWNWRSKTIPSPTLPAEWKIKLYRISDHHFRAEVSQLKSAPSRKAYFLHYAILGFGIESKVLSGENSGETLIHNFAVIDHGQAEIKKESIEFQLDTAHRKAKRLALVTWIEEENRPVSLQSVGLYL